MCRGNPVAPRVGDPRNPVCSQLATFGRFRPRIASFAEFGRHFEVRCDRQTNAARILSASRQPSRQHKGGPAVGNSRAAESWRNWWILFAFEKRGWHSVWMSESKIDKPSVARHAVEAIRNAIRRNQFHEVAYGIMLGSLFVAGIVLFIISWSLQRVDCAVLGAIIETGIILPIGKVASLRKENISLESLPELIAFADSIEDGDSRQMVFLLVVKLIERL